MHYLKDVLRLSEQAALTVIVENDAIYHCKVESMTKRQLHVSIQESKPLPDSTGLELTIIQSLVKQDKLKTILNITDIIRICRRKLYYKHSHQ